MGWTVLYIAFGIVALWLLGEVLLQYKARLRWRLLAFAGFLGVVLGVLIPNVLVIGLGAAAFAVGQTYVTLSFRSGFASGWAVNGLGGGRTGSSKRRRGEERKDPTLEVSDLHAAETTTFPSQDFGQDDPYGRDDSVFGQRPGAAAESTSVYEPQPLPDDTGQYGVYSDAAYAAATDPAYAAAAQAQGQQAQDPLGQNYGYDGYSGYDQQQYGYDTGQQQQYAAYSDPYIGTQSYDAASYGQPYDASQQQYAQQGYTQDPYATNGGYVSETPAGGVWVPQQRNTEDPYGGELPPEQPYPYDGNGNNGNSGTNGGNGQQGGGYDEQYRF
ncbi:SCO2102 family sporulation regulator [Streptomyces phaeochromogenes]